MAASVTTDAVDSISQTSAIFYAVNADDDGGNFIRQRGFAYDTLPNPDLLGPYTIDGGSGEGDFDNEETGLSPGTHYYVRAYIIQEVTELVTYGNQLEFDTLPSSASGAHLLRPPRFRHLFETSFRRRWFE